MSLNLSCCAGKNMPQFAKRCPALLRRSLAIVKKCAPYEEPLCSKERLASLPPCKDKVRRIEAKQQLPPNKSMWEDPECCRDSCPDYFPRYDELYYKTSDKVKREYQQTWVSCPELQRREKIVCHYDEPKLPPMERRVLKPRRVSACPIGGNRICKSIASTACPTIKSCGCPRVRAPPKCKNEKEPSNCQKECAPYPSYSECLHDDPNAMKPFEC